MTLAPRWIVCAAVVTAHCSMNAGNDNAAAREPSVENEPSPTLSPADARIYGPCLARAQADFLRHLSGVLYRKDLPANAADDPRPRVALLLGKMHAVEAVPELVFLIDKIKNVKPPGPNPTLFDQYPCAKALLDFGVLAPVEIANQIPPAPPEAISDLAIELMARVSLRAFGPKPEQREQGLAFIRLLAKDQPKNIHIKRWLKRAEEIVAGARES